MKYLLLNRFARPFRAQKRLEELLYSDRFFKDDFAVVLQPFLKHADPPRLPVLLHPSSKHTHTRIKATLIFPCRSV